MRIEIVRGDITRETVDAVVNAANSSLLGGGGVDGAIHRAGGPEILEACRQLRATTFTADGLPTGRAVATTAGRMSARWVIHTVGPVYVEHDDPAPLLASCHSESLRVADGLGAASVALPAISCGVYGYPVDETAPIALEAVRSAETAVEVVRFVLFDERALTAWRRAAG